MFIRITREPPESAESRGKRTFEHGRRHVGVLLRAFRGGVLVNLVSAYGTATAGMNRNGGWGSRHARVEYEMLNHSEGHGPRASAGQPLFFHVYPRAGLLWSSEDTLPCLPPFHMVYI